MLPQSQEKHVLARIAMILVVLLLGLSLTACTGC